eukprot:TRINITY_DN136_c2_g1_i1.p1 TRINITY_DN136_c2_g1~~TRINITY_DN136_c2_g1_i1.p1  ORF type:complete len:234 (+),score=81.76 TRINITY_DN136_c2_g1_i1:82-702(+)
MAAARGQEKLYSIAILKWKDVQQPVFLCAATDLSSFGFFQRSTVQDFLVFISRTLASRTEPGTRQEVEKDDQRIFVHSKSNGLACVVCANEHYPSQTALTITSKMLMDFQAAFEGKWEDAASDNCITWAELDRRLAAYQKPEEADKVLKIQRDLEDVKTIMNQNISAVLQRGEKLDDLVAQSEDLTGASKGFYKAAKQQNSCCLVM